MINFDKLVVNYINDNLEYIKDAKQATEHYITSRVFDEGNPLSDEEVERFKYVAETLFKQGYVAHAGVLHNEDEEEEEEEEEEKYISVSTIHTTGYNSEEGEFLIGIDGANLDGQIVKNIYLFLSDAEMEEIIASYNNHKSNK